MDSLDAHANLLPFQHLSRTSSTKWPPNCNPTQNSPTHCPCKQSCETYVKSHRLPLHKLLHAYKIVPAISRTSDQSTPAQNNHLDTQPESQPTECSTRRNSETYPGNEGLLRCSCIDGKIGAAAVMFKQGEEVRTLRKHVEMSTITQYTKLKWLDSP